MPPEIIEAPAPSPAATPAPPAPSPAPAAPAPSPGPAPAPAPAAPAAAPVESKWSPTWRDDMAGTLADAATEEEKAEHGKLLTRLKRFNTPADAAKALREADKLISSGTLKKQLPKNATPEQVAEYRKDNGIPEAPDKYDLGVPKDLALSDLDTEMLTDWAAKAHAVNASPEVVKAGTAAYIEMRARVAAQMEERNTTAKSDTTESLRAEWGPDYKTNVDGVNSLLKNSPATAVQDLLAARTEDGVQLLNNPEVMRWLAGHARELGFVGATVVPNGGDLGKGIDGELDDLKKQMGTAEWEKNAKGQARFIQLTEAKNRMAARK